MAKLIQRTALALVCVSCLQPGFAQESGSLGSCLRGSLDRFDTIRKNTRADSKRWFRSDFPLQTDGQSGQFSFNYNRNFDAFIGGRLSSGGFFDLNYDTGPSGMDRVVSEHQLRFRIGEGLHSVTEFRGNEFLPKVFTHGFTTRDEGHGFGLHTSFWLLNRWGGSLTRVAPRRRVTLRLPNSRPARTRWCHRLPA